ncbi:Signal transduction histidine-protein kinase/phosphatase DegS [Streptomyces sp. YIM 130001]|uniref:sensor histidine kinase n=1 Tax=Streptomyces sp. YIM 130001 TaxID=2259644 RepID=UPI000E6521AD|nr:sensor histidine kinase [Streptomyces sp. YIM 130001]RII12378.1 Signal transduction histidine-protein kinase/phosphatase DegS [Streptomyces sp. YIM 130001]
MDEVVRRAGRATRHLAIGFGLSCACYVLLGLILVGLAATALVVGAGMLPETVMTVRRFAGFERRRVAAWTGAPVHDSYPPLTGPLVERLRNATTDPSTYRDLRWVVAQLLYGLVLFYIALIVWVPGLLIDGIWCGVCRRRPVVLPVLSVLADLECGWSRALLTPTDSAGLARRVEELAETRAGAVAAHGAELRRIERDLHDGAQARLVSLSMRIGLAKRAYDQNPVTARALLDEAQDQAEEALAELRHVVRGIHPPVLTDRGLDGAVRALAASSGLDVEVTAVDAAEGPRAPAAVEAAAYFAVAEALTNAAKHSGAERASVTLDRTPRLLKVLVRDEGCGGAETALTGSPADPEQPLGTGLFGIRRRVAALDGTVRVTSPVGGPTEIEVELPCAW